MAKYPDLNVKVLMILAALKFITKVSWSSPFPRIHDFLDDPIINFSPITFKAFYRLNYL